MRRPDRYHGGLVFSGDADGILERFTKIAAATLEDHGHPVDRQNVNNSHAASVVSSHYMVTLSLDDSYDAGDQEVNGFDSDLDDTAVMTNLFRPAKTTQRLVVSLCPVLAGRDEAEVSEMMLVVMLVRMVDACCARSIEWLDPSTVLSIGQFLEAFANVSPRRVRGRQHDVFPKAHRFASVEATEPDLSIHCDSIQSHPRHDSEPDMIVLTEEEALALAFRGNENVDQIDSPPREEQAENDIRRLTAWGMTGMLVFLSGPVAVSMAAVNLVKGEDFRLNTHVLALTGFVAMMNGTGAMAEVVSLLPI